MDNNVSVTICFNQLHIAKLVDLANLNYGNFQNAITCEVSSIIFIYCESKIALLSEYEDENFASNGALNIAIFGISTRIDQFYKMGLIEGYEYFVRLQGNNRVHTLNTAQDNKFSGRNLSNHCF